MQVLLTGSNGFIGKNLKEYILNNSNYKIIEFNSKDNIYDLDFNTIDYIIHLAAIHRTPNNDLFKINNTDLTKTLIEKSYNKKIPIIYTSSVQSDLDTYYGRSKKECENLIFDYMKVSPCSKVFKLTNTFGRNSNPNYLSVVATFCYNISHEKEISINNPNTILNLIYIDDVISSIYNNINYEQNNNFIKINPEYNLSLKDLSERIYSLKDNQLDLSDEFNLKLKLTYDYFKDLL